MLFLLLLLSAKAAGQAPAWQLALAVAPTTAQGDFAEVTATATDATGSVYLAGSFSGTALFGGLSLSSAGNKDAFVAKYSPASASFVWVQRARDHYAARCPGPSGVHLRGDNFGCLPWI